MSAQAVTRTGEEPDLSNPGYIEAPQDPELVYEFLRTELRTIHHYNDRDRLPKPYENSARSCPGTNGLWPVQVDPDDVTRIYFRDAESRRWRTLWWEHAPSLQIPLSEDALRYARRLAAAKYTSPDDKIAVADLLERWNPGLGATLAERRMAPRLLREQSALVPADEFAQPSARGLPSVARVLAASTEDEPSQPGPGELAETGDDDTADPGVLSDDDFYADALEDV